MKIIPFIPLYWLLWLYFNTSGRGIMCSPRRIRINISRQQMLSFSMKKSQNRVELSKKSQRLIIRLFTASGTGIKHEDLFAHERD